MVGVAGVSVAPSPGYAKVDPADMPTAEGVAAVMGDWMLCPGSELDARFLCDE